MGSIRHAKRQDDECRQIAPLRRDVARMPYCSTDTQSFPDTSTRRITSVLRKPYESAEITTSRREPDQCAFSCYFLGSAYGALARGNHRSRQARSVQARKTGVSASSSFFRERSRVPLAFLSGIGMFRFVTTLGTVCYFPFDQLQVEYKDGIKDGDQKQGDECSHSEASDLGKTQRLPQRPTF
jgi:hypothetical protein